MPQEAEVEVEEEETEAEEASEIEAAEVAVEVEVEDSVVAEDSTRTDGLHLPSSVDSLSTERSNPSRKSTPTPSQSRRPKSLRSSSKRRMVNFSMKSCASFPSKSRQRPVKEPDSRPLLPLVTNQDTLELVSSVPRKSKLPLRVPWLMPRSTLSQSEEVIGVQRSVPSIPSQSRLRESAVHVPLE